MVMQLVASIPIVSEPFASCSAQGRILIDRLAQTVETREEVGYGGIQVDQDLVFPRRPLVLADKDGGERLVCLAGLSMGEKALLLVGPEQTIEMLRLATVRDVDVDTQSLSENAFGETAGEEKTISAAAVFE